MKTFCIDLTAGLMCLAMVTTCGGGSDGGTDPGSQTDPEPMGTDDGSLPDAPSEVVLDVHELTQMDVHNVPDPLETGDPSPEACQPTTCEALGKECGIWPDGCDGVIGCPKCLDGQTCSTDGACLPDAGCPLGFEVTEFVVVGTGEGGTVAAGQTLVSYLSWKLSNPESCPACPRQVVLGIAGEPQGCADAGVPKTCPLSSDGVGTTTLTAPTAPGTWNIRAAVPQATECVQAVQEWDGAPSMVLDAIVVPGDCPPETCPPECTPLTCMDIDKACGVWGDGCGDPVDCGNCPGVETCSPFGSCTDPCSQGILEFDNVSLNGGGDLASATPGATVDIDVSLDMGNQTDCPICPRQLVLGFAGVPGYCTEFLGVPTCPDTVMKTAIGSVTAPVVPGSHTLYAVVPSSDGQCPDAEQLFNVVESKIPVGTVQVHQGCTPKACQALQKDCGPWDDGCGFELDCGNCPPGDLCSGNGHCYCTKDDDYEINDTPATAHDLGTFGDADPGSTHHLAIGIENEADWFRIGLLDEMFAIVNPYVHVTSGLGQPFQVSVAYLCDDGSVPTMDVHESSTCAYGPPVDLTGVPEAGGPVAGFSCPSTGDPVLVYFEPECKAVDDGGLVYIGVSSAGPCSAFTVDLHL
ncbi:MAG: hypothetical protein ISR64_04955 [Deltaproteobacteria bacterium]|nr:hypothetical protein [Deltaproteobacteria bacterium]